MKHDRKALLGTGLFGRYRDIFIAFLLLILPFLFYLSNVKAQRDHHFFDRIVVWVSYPVQWGVLTGLDTVTSVWDNYVALLNVNEDNQRLERENQELRLEMVAMEEYKIEAERLRKELNMHEALAEQGRLTAQVIGISPSPLFRSIRIDAGTMDGVELGQAVLSAQGLVGRVAATSWKHSDVMLIIDANSSIDVFIQRSRVRARVRGAGKDDNVGLDFEYLTRTADIEPGDTVLASGLGGIFPKGFLLGRVLKVESRAFGLHQQAVVEPAVDFSSLEVVSVLLSGAVEQGMRASAAGEE